MVNIKEGMCSGMSETPHITCRAAQVQLLPQRTSSHHPLSVQLMLDTGLHKSPAA